MPTEDIVSPEQKFSTIILAAGAGKRMFSPVPKILHSILGKPIIEFVVETAEIISSGEIILVVGKKNREIRRLLGRRVRYAVQSVPRGTGDAAKIGLEIVSQPDVLILSGDVPGISRATIEKLVSYHREKKAALTVLTCSMKDPAYYGRVIRDGRGRFKRIIEFRDASPNQRRLREINTGIYFGEKKALVRAAAMLTDRNEQAEYYLTDLVEHLLRMRRGVAACMSGAEEEIQGVNSRLDLARVREFLKRKWYDELMKRGVFIEDPATTQIDLGVRIGRSVHIRPFTMIEGATRIPDHAVVGPFAWIKNGRRIRS